MNEQSHIGDGRAASVTFGGMDRLAYAEAKRDSCDYEDLAAWTAERDLAAVAAEQENQQ